MLVIKRSIEVTITKIASVNLPVDLENRENANAKRIWAIKWTI